MNEREAINPLVLEVLDEVEYMATAASAEKKDIRRTFRTWESANFPFLTNEAKAMLEAVDETLKKKCTECHDWIMDHCTNGPIQCREDCLLVSIRRAMKGEKP